MLWPVLVDLLFTAAWILQKDDLVLGGAQTWKRICEASRNEFDAIYHRLDVHILWRGESWYNPRLTPLVEELIERGIAEESEGAKVPFLPTATALDSCTCPQICKDQLLMDRQGVQLLCGGLLIYMLHHTGHHCGGSEDTPHDPEIRWRLRLWDHRHGHPGSADPCEGFASKLSLTQCPAFP